jgi:hypothetical protein
VSYLKHLDLRLHVSDSWLDSWAIFSKLMVGEVSLRNCFFHPLIIIIPPCSVLIHITITGQYKTTSSLFKLGAVSVTWHVALQSVLDVKFWD